jgi:hypothetical protein
MGTLADSVVWEMPYAALGHTGFCPPLTVSPFGLTGTGISSHKYDYQISTSGSYSAWKRLVTAVVRSSGGTLGTNTFVINSKPDDLPQIGDYISSTTAGRLPAGTTITNIVGTTITVSNNFLASLGTNEVVHTWKDIQDEPAIDPATGVSLKVRATVITAAGTNALTYITIDTISDATSQLIEYPLPGIPVTITNLVSGSEVRAYVGTDPNTSVEIDGIESSATSFEFTHTNTGQTGYIVVFALGYSPLLIDITYSGSSVSIPVQQLLDRQYNNPV